MEPQSPFRRAAAITLVVAAVLCSIPADAIVIRHDRDDLAYRALGERYSAAVSVLPDGTGVLIALEWVLTAAHVARGVANRKPRVEIAGREVEVSRIFLHPEWNGQGAHDIALLKLREPVKKVTPVLLYRDDDEVGRVITFVGRGDFGTGLTGPETMDRVKRGATNRVDEADADWLFFKFDEGDAATDLEGVSGPGDSGGPALLDVEGKVYTLGVSVFADGEWGSGRYGVREGYTRVSTHLEFIDGVLVGKSNAQELVPGKAPARQRRMVQSAISIGGVTAALPDTAAGRLVSSYVTAYNSNDDTVMASYIESNFADSYRETRTDAEHLALYRRLYDEFFGSLKLSGVREATETSITVLFDGSAGNMAEIRFEIESPEGPRIAGMRVAQVSVSMN